MFTLIKTFKIKTLDDGPVYFSNQSKFIGFEFNMDSQETEMVVDVLPEKKGFTV